MMRLGTHIRLSPTERALFGMVARRLGLTFSALVRYAVTALATDAEREAAKEQK